MAATSFTMAATSSIMASTCPIARLSPPQAPPPAASSQTNSCHSPPVSRSLPTSQSPVCTDPRQLSAPHWPSLQLRSHPGYPNSPFLGTSPRPWRLRSSHSRNTNSSPVLGRELSRAQLAVNQGKQSRVGLAVNRGKQLRPLPPRALSGAQSQSDVAFTSTGKGEEGEEEEEEEEEEREEEDGDEPFLSPFESAVLPSMSELMSMEAEGSEWTVEDSAALYRIEGWGAPYFGVNAAGNVTVRPMGTEDGRDELDLSELIESLRKRNVQLPMIIRFPDIVQHRMKQMQACFDDAIARYGYQGHYQGVFPVKCNQDRYLIEDIVEYGRQFRFGLEAGSKPELLIAIANLRESPGALLICNGYKDRVYIESVLLARQLGVNAIIVLEQMEELQLVIETSRCLGVRPVLGMRAKLSTKHNGHWGETSGDRGKFGLTVNEIVHAVYILKEAGMLDCLQLLHFHIGSQIPSISIIKEAMREASHMYCEMALMGAPMGYVDVGGGLGIDYDGTKSQSHASTNYSMQNYANDVVAALLDACVVKGVPQPIISSESGRSLASHQSVLVFDVLSASRFSEEVAHANLGRLASNAGPFAGLGIPKSANDAGPRHAQKDGGRRLRAELGAGEYLLSTFFQVFKTMDSKNYQEAYNDAKQFKSEAASLFKLGCLSLEQRAQAEALYQAIGHKVLAYARAGDDLPPASDELHQLSISMASVYHINLSIFRSSPDAWAISQIFPIMPLQRLQEEPRETATLADLTCDSDGKINRFVGSGGDVTQVLNVHPLREGEPYYLGLFLAGVYQEVMGSLHNLFGATNVVYVRSRQQSSLPPGLRAESNHRGGFVIEHVVRGQTMEEVLRTARHEGPDMMEALRCAAEEAVADGRLSVEDSQTLLENYRKSLGSYTYLASTA